MLRLTELAMFLAPFAAFVAWRVLATDGGPPKSVVLVAAGVLVLLAGLLIWFSQEAALPPGTAYVPAQFEDGKIVAGHPALR